MSGNTDRQTILGGSTSNEPAQATQRNPLRWGDQQLANLLPLSPKTEGLVDRLVGMESLGILLLN